MLHVQYVPQPRVSFHFLFSPFHVNNFLRTMQKSRIIKKCTNGVASTDLWIRYSFGADPIVDLGPELARIDAHLHVFPAFCLRLDLHWHPISSRNTRDLQTSLGIFWILENSSRLSLILILSHCLLTLPL